MVRSILVIVLIFTFVSLVWAEDDTPVPTPTHSPITTHWTTLGGMQYLQNDKVLSGPELKNVINSIDDQQASALLNKSESDETLGFFGLGGSVVLSVGSLFFPNTHIYIIGLDISTPYMPIAVPGAIIGIVGGLLELEASTAKYTSVQRYNHVTKQSDSVTWNLSPQKNGLVLDLSYGL
jgi:hypothetical protein